MVLDHNREQKQKINYTDLEGLIIKLDPGKCAVYTPGALLYTVNLYLYRACFVTQAKYKNFGIFKSRI